MAPLPGLVAGHVAHRRLCGDPGTRVLWQHVRVLDGPHVVPVHTPVTQPSKPYTIRALVTCATEQCSVVASYRQSLLNGAPFKPLTMQPEGRGGEHAGGCGRDTSRRSRRPR